MRLLSFGTPSGRSFSSFKALSFALAALPLASCSLNTTGNDWGREAGAGGATSSSGASTTCAAGDTRPCYTGPEGTAGVGVCKEGTQKCGAEGVWEVACEGETVPSAEDCLTTNIDEDCNGKSGADAEAGCICVPGATDACLTGKPGVCSAGEHVCDETGTQFGECVQQNQPSFDNCTTIEDEDCDGKATGCLGTPLFPKSYGAAGVSYLPRAVATDADGNVIVGGSREGSFWLTKLSPTGTTLWEKNIPGQNAYIAVRRIAVGPGDEIVVTGDFNGQMDLGGGSLIAGDEREIFVAKRNKDGNHVWAKAFGDGAVGSASQYSTGVALDAGGNIFITGAVAGWSFFDAISVNANGVDAYVAKLDKDGKVLWVNRGGDSAEQLGNALATTSSGDVIVTGRFQGVLGFGGAAMTSQGGNDAFLSKLKGTDGMSVWNKGLGDPAGQGAFEQVGIDVVVDAKENIGMVGYFRKSIDLGDQDLTNPDASGVFSDVFLAQFNDMGALVWGKGFGDANTQVPSAVAVDPAGNIALTGYFRGTFSFGGADLVSPDMMDNVSNVFIARFSSAGSHLWSKGFGDASLQSGTDIATDAKANTFVTGYYSGTLNADAGSMTAVGNLDGFVLGFAP